MKTVSITLYSFDELNKQAQEKAVYNHLAFLDNTPEPYEDDNGDIQHEYVDHTEQDAIESIEANEYMFYEDGELAHITHYTGKHEKAGITKFHFHGSSITL